MNLRVHRLAVAEIDHEVDYYEPSTGLLGETSRRIGSGTLVPRDDAEVANHAIAARQIAVTACLAKAGLAVDDVERDLRVREEAESVANLPRDGDVALGRDAHESFLPREVRRTREPSAGCVSL